MSARYALDTGVLLRALNPAASLHAESSNAKASIERVGDEPVILAQTLMEFWAVATRPASVNGLGWSTTYVDREISSLLSRFPLSRDPARTFETWFDLVRKYKTSGKHTHDMRLVAVIVELGIDYLVTYNVQDFQNISEITVVHPSALK